MTLDPSPYRRVFLSFDARSRDPLDARTARTRAQAAHARPPACVAQGVGGATSPPKSFISYPPPFFG